jgi:hypothetical protein
MPDRAPGDDEVGFAGGVTMPMVDPLPMELSGAFSRRCHAVHGRAPDADLQVPAGVLAP